MTTITTPRNFPACAFAYFNNSLLSRSEIDNNFEKFHGLHEQQLLNNLTLFFPTMQ